MNTMFYSKVKCSYSLVIIIIKRIMYPKIIEQFWSKKWWWAEVLLCTRETYVCLWRWIKKSWDIFPIVLFFLNRDRDRIPTKWAGGILMETSILSFGITNSLFKNHPPLVHIYNPKNHRNHHNLKMYKPFL